MNSEKISINVPVYNCVEFLPQLFDSLLGQTYENLEIIVVDDGSTDGSGELCDEYASKDPRIKVFHPGHQGLVKTRAYGMEKVTGDYVGFADADDWAEPDQFEYLYNLLRKYNADIAQCGYYEHHDEKTVCRYCSKKEVVSKTPFGKKDWALYHGVLWNKLFRREILPPFFTDERISVGEDALYCLLAYKNTKTMVFGSLPKYHYIVQDKSVTHGKSPRREVLISPFLNNDLLREIVKDEPAALKHCRNTFIPSVYWVYFRIARNNLSGFDDIKKRVREEVIKNLIYIPFLPTLSPFDKFCQTPSILLGDKAYSSLRKVFRKLIGRE